MFALGMIGVFTVGTGDSGESTAELVAYAEDKEAVLTAQLLFALVSLGLVGWFVSGLHARVRRMGSQTAPPLVLIGGVTFALLFFLAIAMWSAPLLEFGTTVGSAETRAAAYYLIEDIGWFTLGGAGVGAAVMAVVASLAALRSGIVPAWLGWIGVVVGGLSVATVAWFGIFAWMLWFLVSSILMLAKRA